MPLLHYQEGQLAHKEFWLFLIAAVAYFKLPYGKDLLH